jgi:hypothetical protein
LHSVRPVDPPVPVLYIVAFGPQIIQVAYS